MIHRSSVVTPLTKYWQKSSNILIFIYLVISLFVYSLVVMLLKFMLQYFIYILMKDYFHLFLINIKTSLKPFHQLPIHPLINASSWTRIIIRKMKKIFGWYPIVHRSMVTYILTKRQQAKHIPPPRFSEALHSPAPLLLLLRRSWDTTTRPGGSKITTLTGRSPAEASYLRGYSLSVPTTSIVFCFWLEFGCLIFSFFFSYFLLPWISQGGRVSAIWSRSQFNYLLLFPHAPLFHSSFWILVLIGVECIAAVSMVLIVGGQYNFF